ncbi:MAG TPA: heterodisulfide reductase-related iron-sulfur binding cluster, partial [Xanthomonadales bacterium]|nr:heterodisulfide reductase-related iron-sulfur binding cluster [Xanthomonadales bacterium]
RIAALADQCVKCGLCLPHCPSYRVRGEEGESPRGRIAYAKALALGSLGAGATMRRHLDDCLACGSCEVVCPSRVQYMELIVGTRARLPHGVAARSLRALARRPAAWRALQHLRFLAALAPLLRAWPRAFAALEALRGLPTAVPGAARRTAAVGPSRGRVALFRGCVARAIDADTHEAAARVLARLGYDVAAPAAAHCCGALARHAGATAEASAQAGAAARVFAATGCESIVSTASGCAGEVRDAVARAAGLAADDVLALVAREAERLPALRTDARRVALMLPCTQRDAGGGAAVAAALARIPGLEVLPLPAQPRCCGAAGTYFVEQPGIARPLRDERLEQIEALAPDLVLTTNVGCRIYLQAGLRARGSALRVVHPITLLAEALPA